MPSWDSKFHRELECPKGSIYNAYVAGNGPLDVKFAKQKSLKTDSWDKLNNSFIDFFV